MVRMTGAGAAAASAASSTLTETAAKNELSGVIFSALDLVKPAGAATTAGDSLFNADTLNKVIILIDKLTTLSGNISRIAEKMTAKKAEEQKNIIDATITEKETYEALETPTASADPVPTPSDPQQFAAAAVAIRKLSDENAVLRYKLAEKQFNIEKLDQYLEIASLIIPDDMPFKDVKQKIRDNLPLIKKLTGAKDE